MSEVAGRLSIEAAAVALRRPTGGRGVLMGGVPGVKPAKVVVLGGGVVGYACSADGGRPRCRSVDHRPVASAFAQLDELFEGRVKTLASTMETIENEVLAGRRCDRRRARRGCERSEARKSRDAQRDEEGRRARRRVDRSGGCFETSKPTTHAHPTFEVDGVIHYCVANMPGAVPMTSAQALNNATLPFVLKLADKGLAAFDRDPHLAAGLNVKDGRIMHQAVAASLGFDSLQGARNFRHAAE